MPINDEELADEFFTPVKKTRIIEEILAKMRALMLSGKLVEGWKLPPERELATMLGVSRPSLREVLKVLDILGVIKARQGAGTYISQSFAKVLKDPSRARYIEQRFTLLEVLEARRVIEPALAILAATRASEEDIEAMENALKGMTAEEASEETRLLCDERFHRAIMNGADNYALSQMMGIVWESLVEMLHTTSRSTEHLQESFANHRDLFLAIKRREPQKAKRAVLRVLKLTEIDLLKKPVLEGHGQAHSTNVDESGKMRHSRKPNRQLKKLSGAKSKARNQSNPLSLLTADTI